MRVCYRAAHTYVHTHDICAAIHTARWHTALGADIYKHCVVARYTQRLSFNRSLITRAVRDIGEMGIAKSDARGFLEREEKWGSDRWLVILRLRGEKKGSASKLLNRPLSSTIAINKE